MLTSLDFGRASKPILFDKDHQHSSRRPYRSRPKTNGIYRMNLKPTEEYLCREYYGSSNPKRKAIKDGC